MQFDFLENKHEGQAFFFSIGIIVLGIIVFSTFIFSGGSLLFYLFAVMEFVLGFYMVYHLSKTPTSKATESSKPVSKRVKKQ